MRGKAERRSACPGASLLLGIACTGIAGCSRKFGGFDGIHPPTRPSRLSRSDRLRRGTNGHLRLRGWYKSWLVLTVDVVVTRAFGGGAD